MEHSNLNLLERASSSDPEDWPKFSYSQLQVWDRCEFAWYWNYVEEWVRQAQKASLNIGLLAHALLEIHYKFVIETGSINSIELVDEHLRQLVNKATVEKVSSDTLSEISRAGKIVKRYIRDFAPAADHGAVISAVEHHFEVPLTTPGGLKIVLQGYVDLIKAVKGKVWITDHKTTSNAAFWKPTEVLMDPQMTLYQYAMQQEGVPVHGIEYNFLNSYEYKNEPPLNKLFKRDQTYRSENEVKGFARQVLLQIEKLIKAEADDSHIYARSLRRDCANCQYQEPCLLGLKGIDPTPILVTKFKKKESRKEKNELQETGAPVV